MSCTEAVEKWLEWAQCSPVHAHEIAVRAKEQLMPIERPIGHKRTGWACVIFAAKTICELYGVAYEDVPAEQIIRGVIELNERAFFEIIKHAVEGIKAAERRCS